MTVPLPMQPPTQPVMIGTELIGEYTAPPFDGASQALAEGWVPPASPASVPFSASFARPLPATVGLDPNSATMAAGIVDGIKLTGYGVGVNFEPMLPAGTAQVPLVVRPRGGGSLYDCRPNTGMTAAIPADAASTWLNGTQTQRVTGKGVLTTDSPLCIFDGTNEWEFWQAGPVGDGTWAVAWGGKQSMSPASSGVFTNPYGRAASGISYLATGIRQADAAAGKIAHMLAWCVYRQTSPQVLPANRNDSGTDPGMVHQGSICRFPAGSAIPAGLTPFGQMVYAAIRDYGVVVADSAGAYMLEAEDDTAWVQGNSGPSPIRQSFDGLEQYQVVASLPWSTLEVVAVPSVWPPTATTW